MSGFEFEAIGIDQSVRAIRKYLGPEMAKALNKSLTEVGKILRTESRQITPKSTMTGWDNGNWRGGWSQGAVRGGIKSIVGRGSRNAKALAGGTYSANALLRVINARAAGAIYETASSSSSKQGEQFVHNLKDAGTDMGKASARRLIYFAYERRQADVEPQLKTATQAVEEALQRALSY